jgi:antitoxin ParD1/3/4
MPSSVNLGEKLESVVDDLVKNGRFGSRSEVLREGVRMVEERERYNAYVEQAIAEGLADIDAGRVYDADTVFEELRARFAKP